MAPACSCGRHGELIRSAVQPPPVLPLAGEEAVADYLTATLPPAAAAACMLESIVLHLLDITTFLSGSCLERLQPLRRCGGGSPSDSTVHSAQRPASPSSRPPSAAPPAAPLVKTPDGAVEVPLETQHVQRAQQDVRSSGPDCAAGTPMELQKVLEEAAERNRRTMVAVVRRLLGGEAAKAAGADGPACTAGAHSRTSGPVCFRTQAL